MNVITLTESDRLVGDVDFGEGPRWRDGKWWYSDFYQRAIYTITEAGERETVYRDLPDRPSGLGWMPDGTLLVVFMTNRQLMREDGSGNLIQHADLSGFATWHCNDMVVDAHGNAYVGNFGFDLESKASFQPATLCLVRPDGTVEPAAHDMRFPNGSVITPDGSTLIVGQTYGGDYVAFDIADDATLSNRRTWATLPPPAYPDGCSLDAAGGIWMADARGAVVLRVIEGGEITDRIETPMNAYACALGGTDGNTLLVLCAPASHPDEVAGKGAGAIYTTTVDHPHAGRP